MEASSDMSSLQKLRLEFEYLSIAFSWGRSVAICVGMFSSGFLKVGSMVAIHGTQCVDLQET